MLSVLGCRGGPLFLSSVELTWLFRPDHNHQINKGRPRPPVSKCQSGDQAVTFSFDQMFRVPNYTASVGKLGVGSEWNRSKRSPYSSSGVPAGAVSCNYYDDAFREFYDFCNFDPWNLYNIWSRGRNASLTSTSLHSTFLASKLAIIAIYHGQSSNDSEQLLVFDASRTIKPSTETELCYILQMCSWISRRKLLQSHLIITPCFPIKRC